MDNIKNPATKNEIARAQVGRLEFFPFDNTSPKNIRLKICKIADPMRIRPDGKNILESSSTCNPHSGHLVGSVMPVKSYMHAGQ